EGQAPDLAILDSVWVAEFAAAGFLYALEELDGDWLAREHEGDFLEPLAAADRYEGQTYGVSAFADVAGLWYRRRELESLGAGPRSASAAATRQRRSPRRWASRSTSCGSTSASSPCRPARAGRRRA